MRVGAIAVGALVLSGLHTSVWAQSALRTQVRPMTYSHKVVSPWAEPQGPYVGAVRHHPANLVFDSVVGSTTYDLQTNSAIRRAITVTSTGEVATVWIFSSQQSPWPDRGTGYAYFDGTAWVVKNPTARVETVRTGWPSIIISEAGGTTTEVFISHTGSAITSHVRSPAGAGNWTPRIGVFSDIVLWPRLAADRDSSVVHAIGLTLPGAFGGSPYQGVDGHVLYSRGRIQGDTVAWMPNQVIPGLDSSAYAFMGGDAYAIAVRDSIVAVVYFGDLGDIRLAKSTDNGNTWTVTPIVDFPQDKYHPDGNITDLNGDNQPDTFCTSDGSGAVYIDPNGTVHVVYGYMCYLDDNPAQGDDGWFYYPAIEGLVYWNETMPIDTPDPIAPRQGFIYDPDRYYIAFTPDMNGNDTIDIPSGDSVPVYYLGWVSMPTIAGDENGNLYIFFSGVHENHANAAGLRYRHVFAMRTCPPADTISSRIVWVTAPYEYLDLECVFPAVAEEPVGGKLYVTYQCDPEPGNNLKQSQPIITDNDIVVLALDTTLVGMAHMADYVNVHLWAIAPIDESYIEWDLGDGTMATGRHVLHQYAVTQDTTVTVTLRTVGPCGDTVTISRQVNVRCGNVQADFIYSANGLTVTFVNQSVDASAYFWDFGDGNTSTQANPVHTYQAAQTYTVCLIAYGYCGNARDTICKDVTVQPLGLEAGALAEAMRVYPNPVQAMHRLRVHYTPGIASVRLLTLEGKVLQVVQGCACPVQDIRLEGLIRGIYILEVEALNGDRVRMPIQVR